MSSSGSDEAMVALDGVAKSFVMHLRDGARLPVLRGVTFSVGAGECVVLDGASGTGKSSILKMIFGNYRADAGSILVRDGADRVDVVGAAPRRILSLRRSTIGYVSQFLRVIPRLSAFDIVAAAARESGISPREARARAAELLDRLNIAERLWRLPPATFSGGEQQRVNLARRFAVAHPILLLDEPTAALDRHNRAAVIDFIRRRKRVGAALLGVFHDDDVKKQVGDRSIDISRFRA